jgi:MFS transporter, DHA1 family, inner membrane transport protein
VHPVSARAALDGATRRRLLVLGGGAFVIGTDAYIVAGLLPDMAAGLGVSEAAAGQSVTAFAMTYALLSPVLAAVTGRLPRHRLLVIGIGVLAVANLIVALAGSLGVVILARVIAGAGAALYTPTAVSVSATVVPESRRGLALSVVPGGLTVATVLGVPLGTVVDQQFGWRITLAAVTVLAAVALVGVLVAMPAVPPEPPVPLRERLLAIRRRGVPVTLAVTILGVGGSFAVYTYASSVLHRGLGLPVTAVGLLLFAYGFGAIAGTIVAGAGVDRLGARRTLAAAFGIQVVSLALLWVLGVAEGDVAQAWLAAVVAAAWGAGTWMQPPPQQARLIHSAPQLGRVLLALNASAIYVGIGLGGIVGGLALHGPGVDYLPLFGALIAAAALATLLLSPDP